MKSFIIIILAIAGLLGAVLIMNSSKETITKNDAQDISENNSVESDKYQKEELVNDGEDEHEHEHDEDEHDHSVEIEGSEIKRLTIQEVADLWEINSEELLGRIIQEFDLQGNYTTETTLEYIRDEEYKFSPAIVKDIAEEIKNQDKN